MITNDEKIDFLINKLNNLEFTIKSYIDHAEEFQNKYSLEEKISMCNLKKTALLQELEGLGGSWEPLTN